MAEKVRITGTATVPRWRTYDVDLTIELTLRDLFAAFALAGLVDFERCFTEETAIKAYEYADAALIAREGKGE